MNVLPTKKSLAPIFKESKKQKEEWEKINKLNLEKSCFDEIAKKIIEHAYAGKETATYFFKSSGLDYIPKWIVKELEEKGYSVDVGIGWSCLGIKIFLK